MDTYACMYVCMYVCMCMYVYVEIYILPIYICIDIDMYTCTIMKWFSRHDKLSGVGDLVLATSAVPGTRFSEPDLGDAC